MAIYKGPGATGKKPVPSLHSALIAGLLYEYLTETAALAAGDIIVLGNLEADVKPVDVALIADDLDTNGAPTIQLSVGILNAAGTDLDAAATSTWLAASNAAKTGGVDRASTANCFLSGRSSAVRQLGIKVVTGPATWAGAGKRLAVALSAAG